MVSLLATFMNSQHFKSSVMRKRCKEFLFKSFTVGGLEKTRRRRSLITGLNERRRLEERQARLKMKRTRRRKSHLRGFNRLPLRRRRILVPLLPWSLRRKRLL